MMKLHSIVIRTVLSTLLLTASAAHSMETAPVDQICVQAKLAHIMTSGTLEQFKSALEQEVAQLKPTPFSTHTDLRKSLSQHAKTVRSQKLTQLGTAVSKNRIWASVKASVFGWIAAARIYGAMGYKPLLNNGTDVNNLLLNKECWLYLLKQVLRSGDVTFQAARALIWDILILLTSSTWAYENAHFAYYGNKPLIAEIKKLDDSILYLEQIT